MRLGRVLAVSILLLIILVSFTIWYFFFRPGTTGWEPSKPLEEDSLDLGNIRDPTLKDLAADRMLDLPRFNYWFSFLGLGDDGYAYEVHVGFNCKRGKAGVSMKQMGVKGGAHWYLRDLPWTRKVEEDRIICWAPADQNPESLKEDYVKLTIYDGRYELVVNYGAFIHVEVVMHVESSFWYNKGRVAQVYPGCRVAGIEETGCTDGVIQLYQATIRVSGMGHSEHFFNNWNEENGDIVRNINLHGNEWWVPFRTEQGITGIFVVFGRYKDAGLVIDGEYVIPDDFELEVLKGQAAIRITAETKAGVLEIELKFFDSVKPEYFATINGSFNGRVLSGWAWVEHIA